MHERVLPNSRNGIFDTCYQSIVLLLIVMVGIHMDDAFKVVLLEANMDSVLMLAYVGEFSNAIDKATLSILT